MNLSTKLWDFYSQTNLEKYKSLFAHYLFPCILHMSFSSKLHSLEKGQEFCEGSWEGLILVLLSKMKVNLDLLSKIENENFNKQLLPLSHLYPSSFYFRECKNVSVLMLFKNVKMTSKIAIFQFPIFAGKMKENFTPFVSNLFLVTSLRESEGLYFLFCFLLCMHI